MEALKINLRNSGSKKGRMALFQISLMIIATFAFAFIIHSTMVSANVPSCTDGTFKCQKGTDKDLLFRCLENSWRQEAVYNPGTCNEETGTGVPYDGSKSANTNPPTTTNSCNNIGGGCYTSCPSGFTESLLGASGCPSGKCCWKDPMAGNSGTATSLKSTGSNANAWISSALGIGQFGISLFDKSKPKAGQVDALVSTGGNTAINPMTGITPALAKSAKEAGLNAAKEAAKLPGATTQSVEDAANKAITKWLEDKAALEGTKAENLMTSSVKRAIIKDAVKQSFAEKTTWGQIGSYALAITTIIAISAAAGFLSYYVASQLGASVSQSKVVGYAVAAGTGVGIIVGANSLWGAPLLGLGLGAGIGIGVAVAAIVILAFYKKEPVEVVSYQCLAWQAPSGGKNCDLCNNGKFPCTEYECKSLGQSCEIVNPGTTEEMCYYKDRLDVTPPKIDVDEGKYDDGTNFEDNPNPDFPDERGVRITTNTASGCFGPYSEVPIHITLDEPGICKYSFTRESNFSDMDFYFSNGLSKYNHSVILPLVGKDSIEIDNKTYYGVSNVYVRCEDPNGNSNIANFNFEFCVDNTPDLEEPQILGTNPLTDSYIAYNTSKVDATFYINKPSDCKWDYYNVPYDNMENPMYCSQTDADYITKNNKMVYPCETVLDGLQNYATNTFYVSCKSYPTKNESERVEMSEAYKYTLIGTRPLGIKSVSPNGTTMVGSAEQVIVNLEVKTIEGANDGVATCSYSLKGDGSDFVEFFETNSYYHSQPDLLFGKGSYNILVSCSDAGSNVAYARITFTIDVDTQTPEIARAYYEAGKMVLITTENATCVYSNTDCYQSFEDGISIKVKDGIYHYLDWDTSKDLFIKCEDKFGNRPSPGECNLIVRAHNLFKLK